MEWRFFLLLKFCAKNDCFNLHKIICCSWTKGELRIIINIRLGQLYPGYGLESQICRLSEFCTKSFASQSHQYTFFPSSSGQFNYNQGLSCPPACCFLVNQSKSTTRMEEGWRKQQTGTGVIDIKVFFIFLGWTGVYEIIQTLLLLLPIKPPSHLLNQVQSCVCFQALFGGMSVPSVYPWQINTLINGRVGHIIVECRPAVVA